jgi:hypothetical protein
MVRVRGQSVGARCYVPGMNDKETLAAEQIEHRLQVISDLEAHAGDGHFDLAANDSQLQKDDAQLGGHQTSHFIGHCLAVSLDALRSARLLLTNPATGGLRIPMIGHYPILRTAIESASLAGWLLVPDDARERLRRSLCARMDDVLHDDHLVLVFTEPEPGDEKAELARKQKYRRINAQEVGAKKKRLRAYAAAIGMSADEINRGLPGFGPIVEQLGPTMGLSGAVSRGAWSYISGLTHPSVTRSIAASDVELVTEDPVTRARFTANLSMVNTALDAAVLARLAALRLVAERGGVPELEWKPSTGVPLPPRLRAALRAASRPGA